MYLHLTIQRAYPPKKTRTGKKTNLNPLSANPTKWSNTLKQFVGKSRRIV